jgi:hypothetical protein
LQYGELLAKDQDLDLVGGVGSEVQDHPAQDLGEHEVDKPQRHRSIVSDSGWVRSTRSTVVKEFRALTGPTVIVDVIPETPA